MKMKTSMAVMDLVSHVYILTSKIQKAQQAIDIMTLSWFVQMEIHDACK